MAPRHPTVGPEGVLCPSLVDVSLNIGNEVISTTYASKQDSDVVLSAIDESLVDWYCFSIGMNTPSMKRKMSRVRTHLALFLRTLERAIDSVRAGQSIMKWIPDGGFVPMRLMILRWRLLATTALTISM